MMGPEKVSKRVNVTLPDEIFDFLEKLADKQGRPTSNLAAFYIELGVRDSVERGELEGNRK